MFTEPGASAYVFSVQQALPIELPAGLTGVAVDTDEKTLYIRCFFQDSVTQEDREFMDYMLEAVWADFFPAVHVEVEGYDAAFASLQPAGVWVYRTAPSYLVHA